MVTSRVLKRVLIKMIIKGDTQDTQVTDPDQANSIPANTLKILKAVIGDESALPPKIIGYKSDQELASLSSYTGYGAGSYGMSYGKDVIGEYASEYTQTDIMGKGELMMTVGGTEVDVESLAQAAVILVIGVTIIISNIIVLATFLTMPGQKDVIMYYLMSLGVGDLVTGVVVVPLSVYPALVERWVYGDTVCDMAGYLEVMLWFAQNCTFMWISVDRYLAIKKPLRYETVQTRTRCQCWVVFTWLTSMMLCTPPLLGFNTSSKWDPDACVCWLDWGSMIAYAITLVPLVLGPTLITIGYTYAYIFRIMRNLKTFVIGQEKEYVTQLTVNLQSPDHVMSFVLVIAFWLSWGPCIGIRTFEFVAGKRIEVKYLHYVVFWLGALNSCWKPLIYLAMSPKFRRGLKLLCLSLCCQRNIRDPDENDS